MALSWLDTALVLFILLQLAIGVRQGFFLNLAGLLTLLLATAAALIGGPWLAGMLAGVIPLPQPVLALFLAVLLGLTSSPILAMTAMRLLARLPRSEGLNRLDRAFGIVSGALRGILVAMLAVGLHASLTGNIAPRDTLAGALHHAGKQPMDALARHVQHAFPMLLVHPDGWELVAQSETTVPELPPSELERAMLAKVNDERKQRGLAELRWDGRLASVGKAHSRDMLAKNYFAHEVPAGQTVADRAAKAGVGYMMIGENLAFARTLDQAHRGLMKSPGHRENILRPQFTRLGIGIVRLPEGSRYVPKQAVPQGVSPRTGGYLLITQVFAR